MALRTEESDTVLTVHRCPVEQAQHAPHLVVEFLRGISAFLNGFLVGSSKIIIVVSVGGSHGQAVGPCAELHVESVAYSLIHVVGATPIAHHHSVEFPVSFQDLVQHDGIMAVVLVLIKIVGSHDTPSLTLGNGCLESRQVDLMERTVVDNDVNLMAVVLVVVQRIVFDAGSHTIGLQSLHVGHHHARGKVRVLAHILKVTASQRSAVDIDARTKYHVLATIQSLLAKTHTIETGHLRVPCGSQTGQCGKGHTRVVGLSGLFPLIPEDIGTYAMRSVIGPEILETQSFHSCRREFALCMNHCNLLVERHSL